mmetsp:Transcript_48498/g.97573  ORF Transcript_48498/g.97573 Transcript_48498/m.97573 type:complete len:596 (+) Transcript_48498:53-1840(+)
MQGYRILWLLAATLTRFSHGENGNQQKMLVAFRCVSSQGFLRTAPSAKLGHVLTATRHDINARENREVAWEVIDAIPGWVWIRHVSSQRFVATTAPPDRPAWMATATDEKPSAKGGLFRLEHRRNSKEWFLYSNHTGGYLNCIDGGLIRGHGYYPHNQEAATREPSTEFEVVPLNRDGSYIDNDPLLGDSSVGANLSHDGGDHRSGGERAQQQQQQQQRAGLPVTLRRQTNRQSASSPTAAQTRRSGGGKAGTCRATCKVAFDESGGGYPTPSFSGPLADFVCPSMFRDLSDYVWKWPFSHFKESVSTADPGLAAKCLPSVPIVYAHAGTQDQVATWVQKSLRRPYILMTGQSDWPVSRSKAVLGDPFLVKWFAQNADVAHPKLQQVPIGLNCFEHAPEMHQALQALKEKEEAPLRPHLVLVNFGNTHPSRRKVWDHFCGKSSPNKHFATCSVKSQQNNVRGNPHLVTYYRKVASHKFVAAPRGNGWDTHRLWEALYLGCVPIVESSVLDPLYAQLPVLIVKTWKGLDEAALERAYEKLGPKTADGLFSANDAPLLHRAHYQALIEATRREAIAKLDKLQDTANPVNTSRFRCWG